MYLDVSLEKDPEVRGDDYEPLIIEVVGAKTTDDVLHAVETWFDSGSCPSAPVNWFTIAMVTPTTTRPPDMRLNKGGREIK
jgi:hypothetical protein